MLIFLREGVVLTWFSSRRTKRQWTAVELRGSENVLKGLLRVSLSNRNHNCYIYHGFLSAAHHVRQILNLQLPQLFYGMKCSRVFFKKMGNMEPLQRRDDNDDDAAL